MAPRSAADASHLYRFKDIVTVPSAKDLIDVVLSKTQRKTPTVVHPQYDIRRIRGFYMRKVKFCQQTFHDKFATILSQFPKLDDIHPFYADLCNVLYDKDHFKLALGQVNAVRGVCDTLAKEYVRLLKYADSPYKCKMLKRAALGRMCTTVKKLVKSLAYLEEVRQHLSRLPAINPFTRTLLLAGHPNVGKSTFMNAISNANVEVADWSFTTKSPFVGHFDYEYHKWQVVDTPGVLDRPLTARNTVELTAITAMAHLSCAILFLIDISGLCGHTIEEQVTLFHSLRPLLSQKPVVVVLNKTDVRRPEDLTPEERQLIESMSEGMSSVHFVACSTGQRINLDEAKNKACQMLLAVRKQKQLLAGKLVDATDSIYVPSVNIPSDRPAYCPAGWTGTGADYAGRKGDSDRMDDGRVLEKDLMEKEGGAGVFIADDRKHWDLADPSWIYDDLPEIYNGKNVADFVDPDIEEKLRALEAEEAEIEATWDPALKAPSNDWYETQAALHEVMVERECRRFVSSLKKKRNSVPLHRAVLDDAELAGRLSAMGISPEEIVERLKRPEYVKLMNEDDVEALVAETLGDSDGEVEMDEQVVKHKKGEMARKKLQVMALARTPGKVGKIAREKGRPQDRFTAAYHGDLEQRHKLEKDIHKTLKRYVKPKKGQPRKDQITEADRFIGTAKPKHLYSGKRSIGKTDWR